LDHVVGEVENFADNLGLELGPSCEELGTEEDGGAPVMEEESALDEDFQAPEEEAAPAPEPRMAGRKRAGPKGEALLDELRKRFICTLASAPA
jgi:hypothetical protein